MIDPEVADSKTSIPEQPPSAAIDDPAAKAAAEEDAYRAPSLSPLAVFLLFLKFGARAFGGPVVQINDQREELVVKGRWVSEQRFSRVFAVYAVLPGPEATELACYFGRLAGGRIGGLMGGLGFITPGLCLMLLVSWFYERFGTANAVFASVLAGLQPAMAALVFRACHKIGDGAFRDHATKTWDWGLALIGGLAAFESVLSVNFFIAKVHLVCVYAVWLQAFPPPAKPPATLFTTRAWFAAFVFTLCAPLFVFIGVIGAYGRMDTLVPMGVGAAAALGNTPGAQYVVGLLGGLVTFGGAYTAIPFVHYETVSSGGWISAKVFLDSLAICSVLPTPLVMFVTLIGYASGTNVPNGGVGTGFIGAALMTLGMFTPAFIMPICFHDHLAVAINAKGSLAKFLDAIAATVVGQIAITALQLLRASVVSPLSAVIFFASIQTAYGLPHKFTPVLIVAASAMAGYVLFNPDVVVAR